MQKPKDRAAFERSTVKKLNPWVKKSFGKTAQVGRTLSSGASANQYLRPQNSLLGDIFPTNIPGFNYDWECKFYNDSSIQRFFEGTTRLQSFLEEVTRDARRHTPVAIPVLDCHIKRYGDIIMLPYQKDFFRHMSACNKPCWISFEHYKVKRTGHIFKFLMILTDLKSIIKCMTCKQFIECYKNCHWDYMNKKYSRHLTHAYLQKHSRAEMSKAVNPVAKTFHKVKKS